MVIRSSAVAKVPTSRCGGFGASHSWLAPETRNSVPSGIDYALNLATY